MAAPSTGVLPDLRAVSMALSSSNMIVVASCHVTKPGAAEPGSGTRVLVVAYPAGSDAQAPELLKVSSSPGFNRKTSWKTCVVPTQGWAERHRGGL